MNITSGGGDGSNLHSRLDDYIWFSNFIVRPWSYHPLHISDHLFWGPTGTIRDAFRALKEDRIPKELLKLLGRSAAVPESKIGLALLYASADDDDAKTLATAQKINDLWPVFVDKFRLFDLELLHEYAVVARRAGVGPVSDIKLLGHIRNPEGLPIDFAYFREITDLRPSNILVIWLGIWKRYITRRYLPRT